MSSASSDDENIALLREACDPRFLNNSMFQNTTNTDEEKPKNIKAKQKSLRPTKDDNEQFNLLNVTPEFQSFVAKKLSDILEKNLKKKFVDNIGYKKKKRRKKCGVKLFKCSVEHLDVTESEKNKEEIKGPKFKKIQRRRVEDDDVSEDVKVKEAVITTEDILSFKAVKNWAVVNKGELFCYKKNKKGILVCVEK